MKSSRFNIFIPLGDDEYILYNSLSGAIFKIDEEMKNLIETIHEKNSKLEKAPQTLAQLQDQGIIL